MEDDYGVKAKEAALHEVSKLLQFPEHLESISSIKADYISRQQATAAQLSTMVAEQVEQAQVGLQSLTLSERIVDQLHKNFKSIEKLSQECQAMIENHDQIKLLSNVRNNLKKTLKGGIRQLVTAIFEDPGVKELLVKLYQKEWSQGHVTEDLIATFRDYFTEIQVYIEEKLFRKFVEVCLEETVVIYVDHLLTQKNCITEKTIYRMRVDEEILMAFFVEYISISKVESNLKILRDLRELVSANSLDTITLVYKNILEHEPGCSPDVIQKLLRLRKDIPLKDANGASILCTHFLLNASNNC